MFQTDQAEGRRSLNSQFLFHHWSLYILFTFTKLKNCKKKQKKNVPTESKRCHYSKQKRNWDFLGNSILTFVEIDRPLWSYICLILANTCITGIDTNEILVSIQRVVQYLPGLCIKTVHQLEFQINNKIEATSKEIQTKKLMWPWSFKYLNHHSYYNELI